MVWVVFANFLDGSDSFYGVYTSLPRARHAIEKRLRTDPHITYWTDIGDYSYEFKTDTSERSYATIKWTLLDEDVE